jgi:putative DNA primase/helicase
VTAETIAKPLGGRKAGAAWMARCPAREDREPSLSIKDADGGKVLVRCHVGCNQEQVIAALKARGNWQGADRRHGTLIRSQPSPTAKDEPDRDDEEHRQKALRV